MKTIWRTLWQQQTIVVYRDDVAVDRIEADTIARVFLLYRGAGELPGDVDTSVVELRGDAGFVLFDAHAGFAGRVNFERQAFWRARGCVYWVPAASAALPWRLRLESWRSETLRLGSWHREPAAHACRRVDRSALQGCVAGWRLEGPQIWEQRKQQRIERSRPFGDTAWRAAA